jgi:hypothetical protein
LGIYLHIKWFFLIILWALIIWSSHASQSITTAVEKIGQQGTGQCFMLYFDWMISVYAVFEQYMLNFDNG